MKKGKETKRKKRKKKHVNRMQGRNLVRGQFFGCYVPNFNSSLKNDNFQ